MKINSIRVSDVQVYVKALKSGELNKDKPESKRMINSKWYQEQLIREGRKYPAVEK